MIELPDIEERIYDILINTLDDDWKSEDRTYLKKTIDETLISMGIPMDDLCKDIMTGVEEGYTISYQLELIDKMMKQIFNNK